MATKHIKPGKTMPYTNATGSPIAVNAVIEFTAMVGICLGTIANGATGELAINEVWTMAKKGSLVITQGDQLYWNTTNKNVDKTNTGIPCGIAYDSAASADTSLPVLLNK